MMRSTRITVNSGAVPRILLAAGSFLTAPLLIAEGDNACLAATNEVQRAAIRPARVQRPISLRDRLVVGLKARLKSEVEFVEQVVLRVHAGQLPQRLVDQTFFWARSRASVVRAGRTRRPIIYFQPAMRAQAKRLDVEL